MKHNYITLVLILFLAFTMQAQTFDFSISFLGTNTGTDNYQFALVATPSASVTNGVTADMGAGFYLPTGLTIGNFAAGDSGINPLEWSSLPLGSDASGDGFFLSRVEIFPTSINLDGPGPFQLVLFDVVSDPNPTTGSLTLMENGNALMVASFVENYININLGAGTVNAYMMNDPAASSVDFSALLGVEEQVTKMNVEVYPNPTNDIINIRSTSNIDLVEMYDLLGQRVLSSTRTEGIKVSQLPVGVYVLNAHSEKGKVTKKVIIE